MAIFAVHAFLLEPHRAERVAAEQRDVELEVREVELGERVDEPTDASR